MAKLTLNSIVSGFLSVAKMSQNFTDIEDEFQDKVLYRNNPTGEPNQMENLIDMNSNKIINLPSPVSNAEPARWIDVKNGVSTVVEPIPSQTSNAGKVLRTTGSALVFDDAENLRYTPAGIGSVERTIQSKLRDIISVVDFGAVLDGVTDDSAAVIAAAATLTDNTELDFGFGICLLESTVTDTGTLTINEHGILIEGLTNVRINASSCFLKQTITSAKTGHGGGIVAFKNCTDCSFIGNGTGYTNAPAFTSMSAALVAIRGGCDGITVNGNMTGGRAICQALSGNATSTGTKNNNIIVKGIGHACDRGFLSFFGLGENLLLDLVLDGCSRDLFISGSAKGITGNIVTNDNVTSGIRLEPCSASATASETIQNVDLVVNGTRMVSPINLAPSDTASFAGILKDIKISGYIDNIGNNFQSIPIFQFGNVGSILENIDMSDLVMTHNGTSRGMDITPDVAATIRKIKLPKIIGLASSTTHLFRIDNTIGATIEYIDINDIEGLNTTNDYTCALITGGAVSFVNAIGRNYPSGSIGSQCFSLSAVDHLVVHMCTAKLALSNFTSTNVFTGVNNINGAGWV